MLSLLTDQSAQDAARTVALVIGLRPEDRARVLQMVRDHAPDVYQAWLIRASAH